MFSANRIKYIHFIGSILVIAGCLNLVGWQFDITILKSLSSEMTSMNPITAITFIAAGIWLFYFDQNKSSPLKFLTGIFVALIGILHSAAYYFSVDYLRLDHLLFTQKVDASLINSHLALTTAVLFLMSGIIMISSHS